MRFGVQAVQHPGRVVPPPPDSEKDQTGFDRALHIVVVQEKMADLCDREDEDQIKEEFRETDAVVMLSPKKLPGCTCPRAARSA